MGPKSVVKGIYLVGSSAMTDARDCSVYLVDFDELVLIDTGAGASTAAIIRNIQSLGFDAQRLSAVILTHCHIDHVGGAGELRRRFGSRIIMHEKDAEAIESGDAERTGASWYDLPLLPLPVDIKLTGEKEELLFGLEKLVCLHTPGHTPGSISCYLDRDGERVLFGQDIHGPFLPQFGTNMAHWRQSMETLLSLNADVLCESHFGVYRPANKVVEYIERYLEEYGE